MNVFVSNVMQAFRLYKKLKKVLQGHFNRFHLHNLSLVTTRDASLFTLSYDVVQHLIIRDSAWAHGFENNLPYSAIKNSSIHYVAVRQVSRKAKPRRRTSPHVRRMQ